MAWLRLNSSRFSLSWVAAHVEARLVAVARVMSVAEARWDEAEQFVKVICKRQDE